MKLAAILSGAKDLVILGLLAWTVYLTAHRPGAPGPAPARQPDPAAVQLGQDFARAVLEAEASTLEAGATGPWSTSADAAQLVHTELNQKLAQAAAPLVRELTAKVGPTGDTPLEFGKATALRSFFADVAAGIRKESPK